MSAKDLFHWAYGRYRYWRRAAAEPDSDRSWALRQRDLSADVLASLIAARANPVHFAAIRESLG